MICLTKLFQQKRRRIGYILAFSAPTISKRDSSDFERAVMNYRPMLGGERFMTDKELCARLQLSRRTLQDYRNNGVIPYIQLGGKILYRESDIQKILMANYREAYRMKGV